MQNCLGSPGVYVYVLRCLNIKLFYLDGTSVPGAQDGSQDWFVIKVGKAGPGKAGDGSMEKRLYTEQKEVQKWRGQADAPPKINSIDGRDLMMCFVGPEWVAAEDDIRNRLGPALGVGLVKNKEQRAVVQMCEIITRRWTPSSPKVGRSRLAGAGVRFSGRKANLSPKATRSDRRSSS